MIGAAKEGNDFTNRILYKDEGGSGVRAEGHKVEDSSHLCVPSFSCIVLLTFIL